MLTLKKYRNLYKASVFYFGVCFLFYLIYANSSYDVSFIYTDIYLMGVFFIGLVLLNSEKKLFKIQLYRYKGKNEYLIKNNIRIFFENFIYICVVLLSHLIYIFSFGLNIDFLLLIRMCLHLFVIGNIILQFSHILYLACKNVIYSYLVFILFYFIYFFYNLFNASILFSIDIFIPLFRQYRLFDINSIFIYLVYILLIIWGNRNVIGKIEL